jgi:hypothetical protein
MDKIELSPACFQCGHADPALGHEPGWVTCARCHTRLFSAEEWRASMEVDAMERARKNLGVDEFLSRKR